MRTPIKSSRKPQGAQKYRVVISLLPPSTPGDTNISADSAPWGAMVIFEDITEAHMRKGLSWTTHNFPLLRGTRVPTEEFEPLLEAPIGIMPAAFKGKFTQCWAILEHANRPSAESSWRGCVVLFANEENTLDAGFSLGGLKRQMICGVCVFDDKLQKVFLRDGNSSRDVTRGPLDEEAFRDTWWVWPMESVIPEDLAMPARQRVKAGPTFTSRRAAPAPLKATPPIPLYIISAISELSRRILSRFRLGVQSKPPDVENPQPKIPEDAGAGRREQGEEGAEWEGLVGAGRVAVMLAA
ncbi:hypothetical protein B0T14DRAFT_568365 [Immersiella caudata]|uniref:Uncharacterized protein n=1 Tax=Immersiella caudata TaxID=314043 RepID=A0AA39WJZ0_9PEZI|nr:hypothetical protein B0T14DRAFT_568365 [Immersiella caudata]